MNKFKPDMQVVMTISLVTMPEGETHKADVLVAALPLNLTAMGYVSRSLEVVTQPNIPKEIYNVLGHSVPRLAQYVTEIMKNPEGNGTDIREIRRHASGSLVDAITHPEKPIKFDS